MTEKEDVIIRLRRIEGQVRGLARMVEKEQLCEEILTQLLAVRAALHQAGLCIISRYIEHCLPDQPTGDEVRKARQNLLNTMKLLMRL